MKQKLFLIDKTSWIFIYFLLILIVGNSSCKKSDWFDVKSDNSLAVPSSLKDLQALMDNADVMNGFSPSLGEIGSDGYYLSDSRFATLNVYNKNAYTWSHTSPYSSVTDWLGLSGYGGYQRVFYSNLVLDALSKVKIDGIAEQMQWNNIKGQALFHRAKTFYELAQIFASPYNSSTASTDLSIPLRLESNINIPSKRSSVKETYDQIIGDLTSAKDLLPIVPLYKTRPSKPAVFALLARVCLSMEEYVDAQKYADSCLNYYGNNILDYTSLPTANPNNSTNVIKPFNSEVIFHSIMNSATATSFSNYLIDPNLYSLYSDNDIRKAVFYNKNNSTGIVTYKGTYSGTGFTSPFTGLAVDEIILIRAECYARAGNKDAAINDLNYLLRSRWKKAGGVTTYVDQVPADADDALRKVLIERKKELILRGLRWSDLRRLNKDDRFKITITRTTPNGIFTLEPNSYKYTFPIPDDIIAQTGMQQNPGW